MYLYTGVQCSFLNLTMLYVFLKLEKNSKTFLENVFFFIFERFYLYSSSALKKLKSQKFMQISKMQIYLSVSHQLLRLSLT
jgi:hypothetical protein